MNFLQAIILGIVEGITEFLPISSTGHLILASHLLKLEQTTFVKTFEISIQLAAILAVVMLYWQRVMQAPVIIKKILVAFLPTAVVGLALYPVIKNVFFESYAVILWALFLGGIALILFEHWHKELPDASELEQVTYKQSLLIGVFQSIAVIPGVSRAAATIVGGLVVGLRRKAIVEFSFLLAVPTMLAATGLDLLNNYQDFNSSDAGVLAVGAVTAFVTAIFAIKFILRFIQTHKFTAFGWYRIALAILFWFIIF